MWVEREVSIWTLLDIQIVHKMNLTNLCRISAKCGNVVLNPLKCESLISKSQVGVAICAELRASEEAEC